MMNKYILTISFLSLIGYGQSHGQYSAKMAALTQSVVAIQGSKSAACGVFMTMESMRYTDGGDSRAIQVKVEQPLCDQQQGILAMINPSGADWKYKVIRKEGNIVSEGSVGYNRRIGSLAPGSYLIQFTLPDGTSAIDEFAVRSPRGMKTTIDLAESNKYQSGNKLSFAASNEEASEFIWDFGDGSEALYGGKKTEHTFSKPGTYTVTLTANNFDCSSNATQQIIVHGSTAAGESEN
jgi:hypothetical protein